MSQPARRYSLRDKAHWQRDAEEWEAPAVDWPLIEAEQDSRSRLGRPDINDPDRSDRSVAEQG